MVFNRESLVRKHRVYSRHDESVEVNQCALIDKVLARYSGNLVFRVVCLLRRRVKKRIELDVAACP